MCSSDLKERIEVFTDSVVYLIDDFRKILIYSGKGLKQIKLKNQDKGHTKQFELICEALSSEKPLPISFEELYHSSFVTLEIIRSIKEKRSIEISG